LIILSIVQDAHKSINQAITDIISFTQAALLQNAQSLAIINHHNIIHKNQIIITQATVTIRVIIEISIYLIKAELKK